MQYRVVATDASSAQRQLLWDLCYRVTGAVEDADTLVRDSSTHLVRSVAAPAIEALRTRKRRQYVGSWLPAPVETGNAASAGPRPDGAGGIRYDMVESGTMAFLRALETLNPREAADEVRRRHRIDQPDVPDAERNAGGDCPVAAAPALGEAHGHQGGAP